MLTLRRLSVFVLCGFISIGMSACGSSDPGVPPAVQGVVEECSRETLLSVVIDIPRLLSLQDRSRPEGVAISDSEAASRDTIRRLEISTAELHLVHDPEDLFGVIIRIHDPDQKVFAEMTETSMGKKYFSLEGDTLTPNWDVINASSGNQSPPPAQVQSMVFKSIGSHLVASSPKLIQRVDSGDWHDGSQMTMSMMHAVKGSSALVGVAIALPEERSMAWLDELKQQDEFKNDFGNAMMLGMVGGVVKGVLDVLESTKAMSLAVDVAEDNRRHLRFSHYFNSAEEAKLLHDQLTATPESRGELEGLAKPMATLLDQEVINKKVELAKDFIHLTMDWDEAADELFKKSAGDVMTGPKPAGKPVSIQSKPPIDGPELSYEEMVPLSEPLALDLKPVKLGDKEVQAEAFQIEGVEFLGRESMNLLADVEVIGNKLYVVAGEEGVVHAFNIEDDGPRLTVDTSFGDGGRLELGERIERLSRDGQGRLVATEDGTQCFIDASGKVTHKTQVGGHLSLSQDGTWGVTYSFLGLALADISGQEVTVSKLEITSDQPKREDGSVANFFGPAIIHGDRVVVGCKVPGEERDVHAVLVLDRTGKEQLRFGNTKDVFEPDGFCYLHDIAVHDGGIVTLDSNCRKVAFWSPTGELIGSASATDLLGVRYPWLSGGTIDDNGVLYILAAQKREAKPEARSEIDVAEGVIYRIKGI